MLKPPLGWDRKLTNACDFHVVPLNQSNEEVSLKENTVNMRQLPMPNPYGGGSIRCQHMN